MTAFNYRWRNRSDVDPSDPRGTATYTLPDGKEVEVPLPNFSTANALHEVPANLAKAVLSDYLKEKGETP